MVGQSAPYLFLSSFFSALISLFDSDVLGIYHSELNNPSFIEDISVSDLLHSFHDFLLCFGGLTCLFNYLFLKILSSPNATFVE